MNKFFNKVYFEWNTPDKIPDKKYEPIVCITRNNKLCLFRFERGYWRERFSWIVYGSFEKVVKHYGIKYWTYEKNIVID